MVATAHISRDMRLVALWCPDWPTVAAAQAAGISADSPLAIEKAGHIWVATAAARASGVRAHMRRRDAHYRCPELTFLPYDVSRDARLFECIVADIAQVLADIEVLRPGLLVGNIAGAVRYFGSEEAVAEHLVDVVEAFGAECRIGIADGITSAVLAARYEKIVPQGGSAQFCAGLPLTDLVRETAIFPLAWQETVGLLGRLGIHSGAQLLALPLATVGTRLGAAGIALYQLAGGRASRQIIPQIAPIELTAEYQCDPPLERSDTAAFIGRTLAETFHQQLAAMDAACSRIQISAVTASGEELARVWRCSQPLTAADTADRLRWQLDGWLTHHGPSLGGITLLRLVPVELASLEQRRQQLWGNRAAAEGRAVAALNRVQGLLGVEAVQSAAVIEGRGVRDRICTMGWEETALARNFQAGSTHRLRQWPGALPTPAPATALLQRGVGVAITDWQGQLVDITDRGMLSAAPAMVDGRPLVAWAGPWLVDERWWESSLVPQRQARMQLMARQSPPILVEYIAGRWQVEAVYD